MTPIEIYNEVDRQVKTMRRNGQVPRAVEFGRAQITALASVGKSILEFVVTETVGEAPAFHAVGTGQPYPHVEGRRLALTIIRSDVDDVVRVIE